MAQKNIISIDQQSNLGFVDRLIIAIEQIKENMNGVAVIVIPLIWDQACHTQSKTISGLPSVLCSFIWSHSVNVCTMCYYAAT